jgi:hypothetical protein
MTAIEPAKQTNRQTDQPSNLPAERRIIMVHQTASNGTRLPTDLPATTKSSTTTLCTSKGSGNEEKLYVMTMVDQNAN